MSPLQIIAFLQNTTYEIGKKPAPLTPDAGSSILIFGTIGIFRRYIPLSSGLLAFARGLIGTAFLCAVMLVRKVLRESAGEVKDNSREGRGRGRHPITAGDLSRREGEASPGNIPVRVLILLIISGALIGINWILLFEAYNYTTVATATLCYYMEPALPLVFKEKLTIKKRLVRLPPLVGMFLVSGALEKGLPQGNALRGILMASQGRSPLRGGCHHE